MMPGMRRAARRAGGGARGGAGGDPSAAPELLTFDIDAAKLPKADDLRSRLFPGLFAVSADDEEVRFTSRKRSPAS